MWRRIPSLQRKLLYIVVAFGLSFLIYLLMTNNVYHMRQKDVTANVKTGVSVGGILLNAIQNAAKTVPSPTSVSNQDLSVDVRASSAVSVTTPNTVRKPSTVAAKRNANEEAGRDGRNKIYSQEVNTSHLGTDHVETPAEDPYTGPQNDKQKAIVEAFMHAWTGYKKHAWGHDELKPLSRGWKEWFGVGLTIVDSLDTMWIMGLKDEFKLGRDWVAEKLKFDRDIDVQLFEIVIRELGGLMSAYHFSKDKVFLDKAKLLADGLMPCFKGPTKVPCRNINMKRKSPSFEENSVAEMGTLQLEFRELAFKSGNATYEKAVEAVSQHIHKLKKMDGLVACFLNANTGNFRMSSTVSMGASADSYYEYLLKQWIQTGKSRDWLRDDYLEAMAGMKKHLYKVSEPSKLAFVGALYGMNSKSFKSEMEHLACFLPGTLALGYIHGLGGDDHLDMAKELARTCYEMYHRMPTGLSPEVASINTRPDANEDIMVNWGVHYNLQRPETVESLFYLYRATGNETYRKWGWEIFQAFEKYTRVENGYASIDNVRNPDHVGYRDKMETFYLAETLKYLYLLFSDDPNLIPLDKFVINTEAHPLPVYTS